MPGMRKPPVGPSAGGTLADNQWSESGAHPGRGVAIAGSDGVDVSVIIPTRGRAPKLGACVACLARQTLASYEVLVALDGEDESSREAAERAWREGGGRAGGLVVLACEARGYTPARNDALRLARGRVMVSMNDDVLPEPGCLAAHADLHARAGRVVLVSGASPWVAREDERLFDVLVRETGMIFFSREMEAYRGEDLAAKDWGFRRCYGLNFSAPMGAVREVGLFTLLPTVYGYEDIEMAHKIATRYAAPVLYSPEARARHDHRVTPMEYLEREYKLGYAAPGFARVAPACAREVFRRDILDPGEAAYAREFVARELAMARAAARLLARSWDIPGSSIPGGAGDERLRRDTIDAWHAQHVPAKRWLWRRGLLDALAGARLDAGPALGELTRD